MKAKNKNVYKQESYLMFGVAELLKDQLTIHAIERKLRRAKLSMGVWLLYRCESRDILFAAF